MVEPGNGKPTGMGMSELRKSGRGERNAQRKIGLVLKTMDFKVQ